MTDIYSVLFEKIIAGKYPKNTRLKEESLSKEFNISRTPVRSVLQQLEKDGLVQISPNKGARVLSFSADEIEEIYEIRKSLELLVLDISIPILSVQKLLEFRREFANISDDADADTHTNLDGRFHKYLIDSTGKKRLIYMLNQLSRLIQRFRSLGFTEESTKESTIKEHLKIIDSLCQRDVLKSKELMKKHIENSKIIALNQLFKR